MWPSQSVVEAFDCAVKDLTKAWGKYLIKRGNTPQPPNPTGDITTMQDSLNQMQSLIVPLNGGGQPQP